MRFAVRKVRRWIARLFGGSILLALWLISRENGLLFHAIGEFASVVIAWGMFVFAWNSRRFIDNGYLVFLGIAYLFVGILDFTHVLACDGIGILRAEGAGLSMRVWTVARYLEALSMLAAPLFLRRRVHVLSQFAGYSALVAVALIVVATDRGVPAFLFSGVAQVPVAALYNVSIAVTMMAAAGLLYRHREAFARQVFLLLVSSLLLSVLSQLAFAVEGSLGTSANTVGHILKLVSFYLIFKAIIQTGLEKPYELLFRELKESEQQLQASNIAKDRFFSIMAHDLKDLFNVLFGYSEVLLDCYDQFTESKKKAYIQAIRRSSEQVYRLLENLLYWSRVQAGGLTPQPEPVVVHDVVIEAFALLRAIAEERGVDMREDVEPDVTAWADANMVRVIVRNLVSNAIKFAGRGGHVRVSARARDGSTHVSVHDGGVGMTPEQIDRLLAAGAPARPPVGANEGGTGIGLVLCKEFVALNQGQLLISSRPGRGTRVTVVLPAPPTGVLESGGKQALAGS